MLINDKTQDKQNVKRSVSIQKKMDSLFKCTQSLKIPNSLCTGSQNYIKIIVKLANLTPITIKGKL